MSMKLVTMESGKANGPIITERTKKAVRKN